MPQAAQQVDPVASDTTRPHWQPTTAQKVIASVEGFFGRMLNNQARVLEARTTRTGIPQGPGASVLPPKSYFDNLPPDLDIDGPGARMMGRDARGSVATTATNSSTGSGAFSNARGPGHADKKGWHGAGREVKGPDHSGDAKRIEGRGSGGPVLH